MRVSKAKAWVGGIIGALTYLAPVSGNGISTSESLFAVLAFAVAFNGVYWAPRERKGNV